MKKLLISISLLISFLFMGCSNDPYKKAYDLINMRNDGFRSPQERDMSPTQNYTSYKKERDALRKFKPAIGFDLHTKVRGVNDENSKYQSASNPVFFNRQPY